MVIKIRTEKVIDVHDWNKLVVETYGKPYNFQQQDGCQPRGRFELCIPNDEYEDFERDSIPETINGEEMGVSFKAWLARDPKKPVPEYPDGRFLDLFWGRNFYPSIYMVANDLYKQGLIESGTYSIDIDW